MDYKYHCQRQAEAYAQAIIPVPDDYPLRDGLPEGFQAQFARLCDLAADMYMDMAKRPEADSMYCPKCQSDKDVKSGHYLGQQRYRCKDCSCQFTQDHPREKVLKRNAWLSFFYANGLSLCSIAKIVKVSLKAVFDWVKAFGLETYEKPKPPALVMVVYDKTDGTSPFHFGEGAC